MKRRNKYFVKFVLKNYFSTEKTPKSVFFHSVSLDLDDSNGSSEIVDAIMDSCVHSAKDYLESGGLPNPEVHISEIDIQILTLLDSHEIK